MNDLRTTLSFQWGKSPTAFWIEPISDLLQKSWKRAHTWDTFSIWTSVWFWLDGIYTALVFSPENDPESDLVLVLQELAFLKTIAKHHMKRTEATLCK